MTGAVVSDTVTWKVNGVAAFPAGSLALQVTVVEPIGKTDPEAGEQDRVSDAALLSGSLALTVYETFAPVDDVASAVTGLVGPLIVGAVTSRTTTLNVVGVAALPAVSAALHVTVVEPTAKVEPDAGAHVAGNVPSTASTAFGAV
jgi:hypothetical protein